MSRESEHIGALDGLRAAAIGLVLLYHLTPGRNPNLGLRALPFKLADLGWSGVDLFFVLSGFLITTKLIAARNDEHRFRDFYLRRASRVFPLYYAALFVAFVLEPLATGARLPAFVAQLPHWLYYANFVQNDLPIDLQVGHFWSLAIEEQFYLVWPAVIFFASSRTARRVCGAIAVVALASRFALDAMGAPPVVTFGWTPCRADGLAVGSFLALIYADRSARRLTRPAVAVLAVTTPLLAWLAWKDKALLIFKEIRALDVVFVRTMAPTALALFFGALLVVSLEVRPIARVLSGSFLRAIARWSYGMYVFHFLLYPVFMRFIPPARLAQSANVAATLFFLITATISTLLAALSYRFFESYFLRRRS
ncbi:MAG TPA: acyltransferase [Thermoanaerobaculia bacterium]|nr:acyltransferase [Thermoanaerobaculia bacterium]